MNILKKSTFFLFLTVVCFGLTGQSKSIHFGHLNVEDGLSHNSISKIAQDKNGFLWFTSYVGLNRYDGHKFDLFLHDQNDSTSISSNTVWGLAAGQDGSIWVGTSKGLNKYDYVNNSFQKIELQNTTGGSFDIWDIKEDAIGNIWVATRGNGLYKVKYNLDSISTTQFDVKNFRHDPSDEQSLPNNTIVFVDPTINSEKDLISILSDNTAGVFNVKTEKFTNYFEQTPLNVKVDKGTFTAIVSSEEDVLWISTNQSGVIKYNPTENIISYIKNEPSNSKSLLSNSVNSLLFDSEENLWMGIFGKGLSVWDNNESKIFNNYQYDITKPAGISSNNIGPLYEDVDENIWIGTNGGGINYYNRNQYTFPLFRSNQKQNGTICSNQLRAIFEDSKGVTWLSSSVNGINTFEFDSTGQELVNLKHQISSNDGNIKNLSCHHIFETNDGLLLMCNRGEGLVVFDYEKNNFRKFLYQKGDLDLINKFRFYAIIENDTKYLFGTNNGIFFYDKKTKKTGIQYQKDQVNDLIINTLYEAPDGLIYFGTPNYGFQVFDPNIDSTTVYLPERDSNTSLGAKHIISFLAVADDAYYIGTWDGGLSKFNPKNKSLKTYYESDGLSNNTIYSIQKDKNNKIWLSTNKGLSVFDPISETFKNFGASYNIQGEEYNSRVGFTANDGRMYFGGMTGLNVFYPSEIFYDKKPPKMFITELIKYQFKNGESFIDKEPDIINKSRIDLNYYDKTLRFTFSALKLPKLYNTIFEYQLEGLNNKWISLGTRSEVNLTNLTQGNYKLRIRAVNTNNDWLPQEISLDIKMFPPWWKSWWAYLFYALMILSVFYLIYNYRLSQILKYQRLRTKISSDLHDDVGSILTAAAMQTELLFWSLPEEHQGTFEKIGQLNRKAMEQMRDTVWAIDSRKDDIDSLVDRMQDFAFDIPENDKIEIIFDHHILNRDKKLLPNIRQNIYLIYKEAINNAIKHSNGSRITASLESTILELKLLVKDNGTVDPQSIKSSGLGLNNMKMRIKDINGTINISTNEGFEILCSVPF